MISDNVVNLEDLKSLNFEDLVQLCTSLFGERENLLEIKRIHQDKLVRHELEHDRLMRFIANKNISSSQLRIILVFISEFRQMGRSLADFTPVDLFRIQEQSALSHATLAREMSRLEYLGVIIRRGDFQERLKHGKRIIVDKVSIRFSDLALASPQDLAPGAGEERNHGGRRDKCTCGSRDTRRIYHMVCMDCGEEVVNYPEDYKERFQLERDARVGDDLPGQVEIQLERDARVGDDLPGQVEIQLEQDARVGDDLPRQVEIQLEQDAKVGDDLPRRVEIQLEQDARVGDFFLNQAQSDFLSRWCVLSHNSYAVRNEKEYNCVAALAPVITTTDALLSLYQLAEARLLELAKSQNRDAVPPRLYNLVKCLPDWLASQPRKEEPRHERANFVPGVGRLENWTERRMKGPAPDYSYILEQSRLRDERRKKSGALWKSDLTDMTEQLKQFRKRIHREE